MEKNIRGNFLENIKCKYGNLTLIKEYSHDKYYLDLHTYDTVNNKQSKFDENDIYMINIRNKFQYYPVSQAMFALECISKYYIYGDEEYKKKFLHHINYFISNQDNKGGWEIEFDYRYGDKEFNELKSPWYSALAQGFIISCLVRAYYLENDDKYLDAALKGTHLFSIDMRDGGLKSKIYDKYTCYDEYPTTPNPYVLNGFIFSLFGLYDLYKSTNNNSVKELLSDGLDTLENCITMYDIGFLSMYDLSNHTIPGKPARYNYGYHLTHCRQLSALLCLDIVQNTNLYKILDRTLKRWITYSDGNMAFYKLKQENCILKTNNNIYRTDNTCEIAIDYIGDEEILSLIYVIKNDEVVYKTSYSKDKNINYVFNKVGIYHIKAFYKDKFDNVISKLSNEIIVDNESDRLRVEDFIINESLIEDKLSISIENNKEYKVLEYAYYLIRDNKIVDKTWYTSSNKYSFNLNGSGEYSIKYFIRNIYKEVISSTSKGYIL